MNVSSPSSARVPLSAAFSSMAVLLLTSACAGLFQSQESESESDAGAFRGTMTFDNQSSYDLCDILVRGDDKFTIDRIPAGESVEAEITGDVYRMHVADCNAAQTLYGTGMNWYGTALGAPSPYSDLQHATTVFYDEVPAEGTSDQHAIALTPTAMEDWIFYETMNDPALAAQLHDALNNHASRGGWTETFEVLQIATTQWRTLRNEYTGIITGREIDAAGFARWPDGTCTMQGFGFSQEYNGSGYNAQLNFGGTGPQLPISCAVLEYASTLPGVSVQ